MRDSKRTLGFPTLGVPHLCGPGSPSAVRRGIFVVSVPIFSQAPSGRHKRSARSLSIANGKLDASRPPVKLPPTEKAVDRGNTTIPETNSMHCDQFPDEFPDNDMIEIPDLANMVEEIAVDHKLWITRFSCKLCGQFWEERYRATGHGEVASIVKIHPQAADTS